MKNTKSTVARSDDFSKSKPLQRYWTLTHDLATGDYLEFVVEATSPKEAQATAVAALSSEIDPPGDDCGFEPVVAYDKVYLDTMLEELHAITPSGDGTESNSAETEPTTVPRYVTLEHDDWDVTLFRALTQGTGRGFTEDEAGVVLKWATEALLDIVLLCLAKENQLTISFSDQGDLLFGVRRSDDSDDEEQRLDAAHGWFDTVRPPIQWHRDMVELLDRLLTFKPGAPGSD